MNYGIVFAAFFFNIDLYCGSGNFKPIKWLVKLIVNLY